MMLMISQQSILTSDLRRSRQRMCSNGARLESYEETHRVITKSYGPFSYHNSRTR
jgi:hypothetical protein